MENHISLGKQGEIIARAYVAQYCKILHVNWKSGKREIDIIAEKNGHLFFIEVKTRNTNRFGWPEEAVNGRKQEHIRSVATDYLHHFNLSPATIRFDIIAITFQEKEYELVHFRDVF
ncbi:YraN family protein [Chitinophaga sp. 212800010-3]|uniref:YraN family protein n=1 Tax=unclassified Chitinophaga TaxID=2619133 RepID=UPI002DEEAB6C|nr:hypothetical protein [Chitinophaga sp. 212800010-3]